MYLLKTLPISDVESRSSKGIFGGGNVTVKSLVALMICFRECLRAIRRMFECVESRALAAQQCGIVA